MQFAPAKNASSHHASLSHKKINTWLESHHQNMPMEQFLSMSQGSNTIHILSLRVHASALGKKVTTSNGVV